MARLTVVACIGLACLGLPGSARAGGWARHDLKPITQPAPIGSLFALEVAERGAVRVVALDAASGRTVWSADASTSEIAPGEPPELAIVGGNVVYLASETGSMARVTSADGQTGAVRWQTDLGSFNSSPSPCVADASAICVSGALLTDAVQQIQLRFDAASGSRLPSPAIAGDGPREVGAGLFDNGSRDPERLVATRGGAIAWSRPLAKIFTLPGASTDWGWNFGRIERLGLFVGSPGFKPRERGSRFVFDLSRSMTAGFRIADGAVRWRRPGRYVCVYLPCPGDDQAGYAAPELAQGGPTVGLRTVERGTLTFDSRFSRGVTSADARVTIEGFAPKTGRTLWRFAADRNSGLVTNDLIPAQVAASTVVLRGGSGRLVALDLATGSRRASPRAVQGWCRRRIDYHQDVGYPIDGDVVFDYSGQLVPCAASTQARRPAPEQAPAFLAGIGAGNAGLIAWSDTTGVSARPPGA